MSGVGCEGAPTKGKGQQQKVGMGRGSVFGVSMLCGWKRRGWPGCWERKERAVFVGVKGG